VKFWMRTVGRMVFGAVVMLCAWDGVALAQGAGVEETVEGRVKAVMGRAEFARANFGVEFFDLETGKVLYAVNADKLFVPASTTKLLTEGTVLARLGGEYRFHTRIYRTGPIEKNGTLKGNLVLVASGDPNLSNRIQPDGTLSFVDEDHSYNGQRIRWR
jgi:D-alanyl-D-alanine carboxypeptidase